MKTRKEDAVPERVSRPEFNRILGNLLDSEPLSRKDARTGEKKKSATIIPSKPEPDPDQR